MLQKTSSNKHNIAEICCPETEFKEFERRLKFKPRLKYGWFHLKLYSMFQDLSRRSIETGFGGFKTRLKFIKSGHWRDKKQVRKQYLSENSKIFEIMKSVFPNYPD